jgi:cytoskeleton protein RodZ
MKHRTVPEENNPSENTVDGPGSQLRKARERKGLDQTKVAAQLHLSQSMIQALEWDDYEHLPAAVFVQGYLRKYARLMGVDEDTVIQSYQELQPDTGQQPLPRNQPDDVAKELHNDHRLIRYIAWIVLLALGVLIFFWWQSRMDTTEPSQPTEESRDTIEPVFAPPQQDELKLPRDETLPPIREPDLQPSPSVPEVPLTPVDEEAPLQPVATEPEQTETVAPVSETPAVPVSEIPAEIAPVPEADTEPELPAPISDGLVVFEFSGPCWVEVRDANGRARIIGVMREGMRRSLDAQLGPFRVVIGDIQAARVSVNGEDYNLRRHTRGKVARFTLDPSRL